MYPSTTVLRSFFAASSVPGLCDHGLPWMMDGCVGVECMRNATNKQTLSVHDLEARRDLPRSVRRYFSRYLYRQLPPYNVENKQTLHSSS